MIFTCLSLNKQTFKINLNIRMQRTIPISKKKKIIWKQVTLIFIHYKKAISAAPSDLVTINLQHLTQALEKKKLGMRQAP